MTINPNSFTRATAAILAAFATISSASALQGVEAPAPVQRCDVQLSGFESFDTLQAAIDNGADLNRDGVGIICLSGTIVNDDRPEGAGQPPRTITLRYTSATYPIIIRGNRTDGVRAIIKKIRTRASNNATVMEISTDLAYPVTLENLDIQLDYQRSGTLSVVKSDNTFLAMKNVRIKPTTLGGNLTALETHWLLSHGTENQWQNLDIDLRSVVGQNTGFLIDRGQLDDITDVIVRGNDRTVLLKLSSPSVDESIINSLSHIEGNNLGDGIILEAINARIGSFSASALNASGAAISVLYGRIDSLGGSVDPEAAVTLRSCGGLVIGPDATIASVAGLATPARSGC